MLGLAVFSNPVRAVASVFISVSAAAALVTLQGAGTIGATMLWVLGAGAAMLLLLTALLLNLSDDETGERRYSVQATLLLLGVAYVAAEVLARLSDLEPQYPDAGHSPSLPDGLFESHGVTFALVGLTLLCAAVSSLIIARRRG